MQRIAGPHRMLRSNYAPRRNGRFIHSPRGERNHRRSKVRSYYTPTNSNVHAFLRDEPCLLTALIFVSAVDRSLYKQIQEEFLNYSGAKILSQLNHARQCDHPDLNQANQAQLSLRAPRPLPFFSHTENVSISLAIDAVCRVTRTPGVVGLPRKDRGGDYNAWVPCNRFFRIKSEEDRYWDYFGDDDEGLKRAARLHNARRDEAMTTCPFDLFSDGEADEDGNVRPARVRQGTLRFNGIPNRRRRLAQRSTILNIVSRHGQTEFVWHALAKALDLKPVGRVRYVFDVARRRDIESGKRKQRAHNFKAKQLAIWSAMRAPKSESTLLPVVSETGLPLMVSLGDTLHCPTVLQHFCFACQEFCCGLHDSENVLPRKPIPDTNTEQRIGRVRESKINCCSQRCYRMKASQQEPERPQEKTAWNTEEIALLREAVMIFKNDPCNLATVVGSRSCREIRQKLDDDQEKDWNRSAAKANKVYQVNGMSAKWWTAGSDDVDKGNTDSASYASTATTGTEKRRRGTSVKKSTRARKTTVEESGHAEKNEEEARYVPCDHEGSCADNPECSCSSNNITCENRCACSGVRVTWEDGELVLKGKECLFRRAGCRCRKGGCLVELCTCARDGVVCDPDVCKCKCQLGDHSLDRDTRSCRSIAVVSGKHKKTFVGKSQFGFGLFAGAYFEKGDLVGIYRGGLFDPSLVGKNERDVTFGFDLTDDRTIDAMHLGSKVKYVNHAATEEDGLNCESKFQRIRGEAVAILRTLKAVRPGEEFFFDYKLSHAEGNEWLKSGN